MSLEDSSAKEEVIKAHRMHEKDTGSPEVQVALLTKRLEILSEHFKRHPQDKHSRRGLLDVVSKRKRLLQYLKREDINRYRKTIQALGLRK
ncbi:MAG: 30S ribosomal protein S15 [Candidatus Dadabacteria bacterium]|nr:MAG: 30S ribosomal protein S15 [Candidatus Dadabacteria bacterium]